jgi:aminoglycoside phosphotransferase (APT) family kinase protein
MIPTKMLSYREKFPIFEEATEWQLLRKWTLSEVYRITFPTGDTQIVKWGGEEMAREMDIYSQLLGPLRIRTPQIYGYCKNNDGGLIVMEDAGERDLEQRPMAEHFIEAARELARLRITAANSLELGTISRSVRNDFTVTCEDFLGQLEDLIQSPLLNDNPIIQSVRDWLPEQLKRLYQEVPLTLVHHDYHAKNLLVQGDRILPIDWSNAYLSPHLGDLHSVMKEAQSA